MAKRRKNQRPGPNKKSEPNRITTPLFSGRAIEAYTVPKDLIDNITQQPDAQKRRVAVAMQSDSTLHITGPSIDKLLMEYNQALVDNGFALSRRELRKKDMIDARALFDIKKLERWQTPEAGLTDEDRAYMAEDYWYAFIPCFEEGVLQINGDRYIYWRITEISTETSRMVLYLHDYVYYDETGWQPGVSGTVAWKFNPTWAESLTKQLPWTEYSIIDGELNYEGVYRILDPKTALRWDQKQIAMWNDTIVDYATQSAKNMWEKFHKSNMDYLASLFASYICKVNHVIAANKVQKSRVVPSEHADHVKAVKAAKASGQKPPLERRIRVIGGISITSARIPRTGRKNVMANYKIPAWTTRGHLRTLKSGKKVFVRQSVHHRKALKQPDAAPVQTPLTIKFKESEDMPNA